MKVLTLLAVFLTLSLSQAYYCGNGVKSDGHYSDSQCETYGMCFLASFVVSTEDYGSHEQTFGGCLSCEELFDKAPRVDNFEVQWCDDCYGDYCNGGGDGGDHGDWEEEDWEEEDWSDSATYLQMMWSFTIPALYFLVKFA